MLRGTAGHCKLQLAPSSRPAVRAPCSFVGEDTPAGLHTWTQDREFLLDGRTGRVRAQNAAGWGLGGIAPNLVLERYGDAMLAYRQLRLVDLANGERRRLRWPSTLGWLDEILPQPHGTLVAVSFADPSIQASDVWILDTATRKFWHLPGFPASISLKFSSMAWTSDDRLVLLVERDDRTRLAVWTPGSKRLPQRAVQLPPPSGGSDSFVPLVGP